MFAVKIVINIWTNFINLVWSEIILTKLYVYIIFFRNSKAVHIYWMGERSNKYRKDIQDRLCYIFQWHGLQEVGHNVLLLFLFMDNGHKTK